MCINLWMLKIHNFYFWYMSQQWFAIPFIIPLLHKIAGTPFPIWGKEKPERSQFLQQSEPEIHFQDLGKLLSYAQMFFKFQMSLCLFETWGWWPKCRDTLSNHMVRASQKRVFQLGCPAWPWTPCPRLETEGATPWEARD